MKVSIHVNLLHVGFHSQGKLLSSVDSGVQKLICESLVSKVNEIMGGSPLNQATKACRDSGSV